MKEKNVLKNAGVFLIAVTMALSATVVTASFTNIMKADCSLDVGSGFEKILPPEVGGRFGYSVCSPHVSDIIEASIVLIGAPYFDTGRGAVYVYEYDPQIEEWLEKDMLIADDGVSGDMFGWSVSAYGSYILVGAPYDGDNGVASGSAYLFEYDPQVVRLDAES